MTSGRSALRVLAAFLGAADGGQVDVPTISDGVGWEPVLALAASADLLPALWSAVRSLNVLEPVPDELVEVLGAPNAPVERHPAAVLELAHRQNGTRNTDLLDQLEEIGVLFSEHDIRCVAIKGVGHVARGVWPDPGDRVMKDVDLLVASEALAEADRLLRRAGYAPCGRVWTDDSHHHLTGLRREHNFGSVELHREPLSGAYTAALRATEVFAAARPIREWSGVYVPSATHAAVIGLVHAYLADGAFYDRAIPLRAVHELSRLDSQSRIEWSETRRLLRRVGRACLIDEQRVTASALLGITRPQDDWKTVRARLRLAIAESSLKRACVPVDRMLGALDAGRLRRHYRTPVGGPWRLRAHHLRAVARRTVSTKSR